MSSSSLRTRIKKYVNLFSHIRNPDEYILRRGQRYRRPLQFVTKPHAVKVTVPYTLYSAFKEIFMMDFYGIRRLLPTLPPNPVIIDIGANAGYFETLLFAKLEKARVLAFEPLPGNFELLKQNVAQNPVLQACVKPFEMAVVGTDRNEITFYVEREEQHSVIASIYSDFDNANTVAVTLPCVSLRKAIADHGFETVDLLKMDCEGSEYEILYNTPAETLRQVKQMIVEVHDMDTPNNNLSALSSFLQENGFSVEHHRTDVRNHYLYAHRK
jgi:FkbM family methyltransferase